MKNTYQNLIVRAKTRISIILIIALAFNPEANASVTSDTKTCRYDSNIRSRNLGPRGPMILIEGLDLAGKSTLTRGLVTRLKSKNYTISYSRNSMIADNRIALKADLLRREPDAGLVETGALFLAAHLYDIHNFKYPEKHTIHIQDSSWLRTIAYHSLHNTRWIPQFVDEISADQPKFDVVIYLTASTEIRRQRVLKREAETEENDKADYMSWFYPEKVKKHDQLLWNMTKKYYPHARKIDTTKLSAKEVQDQVLKFINNQVKLKK
jgi:thymidylate kinase